METIEPALLTPSETAAYLSISTSTLWRLTREGTLPAPIYLSPRSPRWSRTALDRHIATLSQATA